MHASMADMTVGSKKLLSLTMSNMMAIGYFDLTSKSGFSTSSNVTLTGTYNSSTLDLTKGTLESATTGDITLSSPSANYYTVLIPGAQNMSFKQNSSTISCDASTAVEANQFRTDGGNSIKLTFIYKFSVSDDKQVQFSKGNLYYDGSTFKFEDNQYSYQSTYQGTHVSHFRWAKNSETLSDDISSAISTLTSLSGEAGDIFFTNATLTTPRADFAVEGVTGKWRTLSGGESGEWVYLLNTRSGDKAPDINGNTDCRFAYVKVNGVCGLLIFPDTFTWPTSVSSIPCTFNQVETSWNSVNYTLEQFTSIENAGCVFLPAAGQRDGSTMNGAGSIGCYWSSSPYSVDLTYACYLLFKDKFAPGDAFYRYLGHSVRLVRDVK